MKFEVKRGSVTIMQTEQESCIPDREDRDILRKAGYKMYLDGKVFTEKKTIKNPEQTTEPQEEQMDGQMSLI